MTEQEKSYTGDDIVVRYNRKRCIHFAACVRGLPAVFDTDHRPWISPDNAQADVVAAVVKQCPTGALHFERLDGGAAEQPESMASIRVAAHGPLYLRGDIMVQRDDETQIIADTRIALCRCGMSENKPFCDGSHKDGFRDDGHVEPQKKSTAAEPGPLTVVVTERGPYQLKGTFTIRSAYGRDAQVYTQTTLCRCGASKHKPFCDNSHKHVDQEIWNDK